MRRRPRRIQVISAAAALALVTLVGVGLSLDVQAHDTVALARISVVVAILGVVTTITLAIAPRIQSGTKGQGRSVAEIMPQFVIKQHDFWNTLAVQRHRLAESEIPLGWKPARHLSSLNMSAVSISVERSAFHLPPSLKPLSKADIAKGGEDSDLYNRFIRLPMGRLVIVGEAGAGKTTVAIDSALRAFKHRDNPNVSDAERERVPVPVLVTVAGWNTTTENFEEWVARQMASKISALAGPYAATDAVTLLNEGLITVVVDGFDEISEALRPKVIVRLGEARVRVMLLARSEPFARAIAFGNYLRNALVVELERVPGWVASDYLRDTTLFRERPHSLSQLEDILEREPNGSFAESFSTPLNLNLVASIFRSGDDLPGLFPPNRSLDKAEIRQMLFSRKIAATFHPANGQSPRWSKQQAESALTFLAAYLQSKPEIEEARRAARESTPLRRFAERLRQRTRRNESTSGARVDQYTLYWWEIATACSWIPSFLVTLLIFGAIGGAYGGPVGIVGGLVVGAAAWIVLTQSTDEPVRIVALRWKPESGARLALAAGIVGGGAGVDYAIQYGVVAGLAVLVVAGIAAAMMAVVESGLAGNLMAASRDDTRVVDPLGSWRNDRSAGLARGVIGGVVFGVVTGLGYATVGNLVAPVTTGGLAEPTHRLIFQIVGGGLGTGLYTFLWALVFGVCFGLVYSYTWPARLAFVQLRLRYGRPLRLLAFLEDARSAGILHASGPGYEFFSSDFQDYLTRTDSQRKEHPNQQRSLGSS